MTRLLAGLIVAVTLTQASASMAALSQQARPAEPAKGIETCFTPAAPASGGYGTGTVGKAVVFLRFPASGTTTANWAATGAPPGIAVTVTAGMVLLSGYPSKPGSYTTRLVLTVTGCPTVTYGPYFFPVEKGKAAPTTTPQTTAAVAKADVQRELTELETLVNELYHDSMPYTRGDVFRIYFSDPSHVRLGSPFFVHGSHVEFTWNRIEGLSPTRQDHARSKLDAANLEIEKARDAPTLPATERDLKSAETDLRALEQVL